MFKRNELSTILILIFVLITLEVSTVYSQADTSSGIGVIPSGQTWFTCSRSDTNFISYMMQVVVTSEPATPGFGTNEVGNHPKQYDKEGLLVFMANYTGIRSLVDPNRPPVQYRQELSCAIDPVQTCNHKTDPPLLVQEIQCIGIVNPNQGETKFSASISFDANAPQPILVVPMDNGTSPNPTTTQSSTTPTSSGPNPTETNSFFVNIANRPEIIDFKCLLVLSWSFSIFISVFI